MEVFKLQSKEKKNIIFVRLFPGEDVNKELNKVIKRICKRIGQTVSV